MLLDRIKYRSPGTSVAIVNEDNRYHCYLFVSSSCSTLSSYQRDISSDFTCATLSGSMSRMNNISSHETSPSRTILD